MMKRQKDTDRLLREEFRKNMPEPGFDADFTRKVMNRLPARRCRLRWLMPSAYILAAVIGSGLLIALVGDMIRCGSVTVGDMLAWIAIVSTGIIVAVSMVSDLSGADS